MSLQETLGNKEWLAKHEKAIKEIFPETWTHVANLNGMKIGYNLKLVGVDWRSEEEFGKCMVFFERIGFLVRDGLLVKRGRI